jgi:hypothetical protein
MSYDWIRRIGRVVDVVPIRADRIRRFACPKAVSLWNRAAYLVASISVLKDRQKANKLLDTLYQV